MKGIVAIRCLWEIHILLKMGCIVFPDSLIFRNGGKLYLLVWLLDPQQ